MITGLLEKSRTSTAVSVSVLATKNIKKRLQPVEVAAVL